MRYNEVSTNLKSRRLLPSRYACHLPPGGRLFVNTSITQIGRENNISAEIRTSSVGEGSPLPKSSKLVAAGGETPPLQVCEIVFRIGKHPNNPKLGFAGDS